MKIKTNYYRAKTAALAGLLLLCALTVVAYRASATGAYQTNSNTASNKKKPTKPQTTGPQSIVVPRGEWGGSGAIITVGGKTVAFQFDCSDGEIRQPLKTDSKGNFNVNGFFRRQRGGPMRSDSQSQFVPAIYKGSIKGKIMTFIVALNETDAPIAEYSVESGKSARLMRCM